MNPKHRIEVIGGLRFFKAGEKEDSLPGFFPETKRFMGFLALHLGENLKSDAILWNRGRGPLGRGFVQKDACARAKQTITDNPEFPTECFLKKRGVYAFDLDTVEVDFVEVIEERNPLISRQELLPGLFDSIPLWLQEKQKELDKAVDEAIERLAPNPVEDHRKSVQRKLDIEAEDRILPFIEPMVVPMRFDVVEPAPKPLKDILWRETGAIILMAEGGGGKTTALASLWSNHSDAPSAPGSVRSPTLFSSLSDLNDITELGQSPVDQLLISLIFGDEAWREKTFKQPRTLLILDGLNELSGSVRDHAPAIVSNLKYLAQTYFGPRTDCRLVLGCRPQELAQSGSVLAGLPEDIFPRYRLCPLDFTRAFGLFTNALKQQGLDAALGERLKEVLSHEMLTNPLNLSLLLRGMPHLKEKLKKLSKRAMTRADLLDMALTEILDGDEKRDRAANLHAYFGDGDKTRFALQLMAAVMLRKADGATSLDRNDLVEGISEICREETWPTRSKDHDVLALARKSSKDFVDALGNLRLVAVDVTVNQKGQFSFQHDVWRDYFAGTLLVDAGWNKGKFDFAGVCRSAWQEAVLLAVEMTENCIEPIIASMTDAHKPIYERRRAAQIWGQTQDISALDEILSLFDARELVLADFLGHILRDRARKNKRVKSIITKEIDQFLKGGFNSKIKATHIINGLGKVADATTKDALRGVIKDLSTSTASAVVRASAIYASEQFESDSHLLEMLKPICVEPRGEARNAAWETLWRRTNFSRDPGYLSEVKKLIEAFLKEYASVEERFHLFTVMGHNSMGAWATRQLVDAFNSCEKQRHCEVLRWYIARCLQRYWHRRYLTPENLEILENAAQENAILQLEIDKLKRVKDIETPKRIGKIALDARSNEEKIEEALDLWKEWKIEFDAFHKSSGTAFNLFYDTLPFITLVYQFFLLAPEGQQFIADDIYRIMSQVPRKNVDGDAEKIEYGKLMAVAFASKAGLFSEPGSVASAPDDIHISSLCGIMSMDVLNKEQEDELFMIIGSRSNDELIRWRNAGALMRFSATPDVCQIASILFDDNSALSRGFMADALAFASDNTDVEALLVKQLQREQDVYALARVVRVMGKIGSGAAKEALEKAQTSSPYLEEMTRIGRIDELITGAIAAIENAQADDLAKPPHDAIT